MVVTEMDTSNRVSDKGLGVKRKGSETLGFSPPQKPNFEISIEVVTKKSKSYDNVYDTVLEKPSEIQIFRSNYLIYHTIHRNLFYIPLNNKEIE